MIRRLLSGAIRDFWAAGMSWERSNCLEPLKTLLFPSITLLWEFE